MDDEVSALVVDNGSGSVQSNNESNSASADGAAITNRYARVGIDGLVIIIKDIPGPPPTPDWKLCKADTKVGSKY
ncbi:MULTISPECIES: hypothetical protein [Pseudomonas]|jgi:hypothetical protein|uniref:Uncharacterized protein n=2 Tax=Pseudomonas syringae TaxID=317 RepID=A0AAQ1R8L6_PSESX|nr:MULTISPECIES: hypothetical protein [Pseudomonas]KEZ73900.1 hypothetical protein C5I_0110245 [Pseudomonas syringae pv. syringae FF5]AKF51562.1 hypothetical protein PsyrH_13925 [Pseudomonas syringae pv. syringae HS191]MBI6558951.1 hypothetical protein [Pseudomonas syringae]MBI6571571.1 hypothetical protein [Pseudomonas syringae]MBI6587349.1 hypothetical protein [Pseudomonas syringae]